MKKISSYLLFISFITLIAVLVVIIQQSYDKLISSQQKISSDIILKPIKPELDIEVLDELEKKVEYTESDLNIIPTIQPIPTVTFSPSINPKR